MRDHATRRPIPVEQSILWKPLHDSHYVVASLQPADGGRRKIFVRQQVLGQVEALVRAQGRRAVGLLLGHFYSCPQSFAEYVVIESVAEQIPVADEAELEAVVAEALAAGVSEHRIHMHGSDHRHHAFGSTDNRSHVIGWFRGVASIDAKPSPWTAGVHTSMFPQPWQVTLVVGESDRGGAFFLRDATNSRWFFAPFYELPEHAPKQNQPKPTLIDWPQYITADSVALTIGEATVVELADVRSRRLADRPSIPLLTPTDREPADADGRVAQSSIPLPADRVAMSEMSASASMPVGDVAHAAIEVPASPAAFKPADDEAPLLSDRPAPTPVHEGIADLPKSIREKTPQRRSGRWADKLSIVDDRDQRSKVPSTGRAVRDDDDTVMGDNPARYIDLARAEGFFIAAQFDAVSQLTPMETLWILNEPYSGMLLTVVTTATEVVDATLHYNVQTDDAGVQRTPFPEHRDPESKTIYVRETSLEALRARCRRLRAMNALVREWKVTPAMSFLTPTEWESLPAYYGGVNTGASAIADLTNARIAELPEGIRDQFHLVAQPRP